MFSYEFQFFMTSCENQGFLDFVSGNIHQYLLSLRRIIVKYTMVHVIALINILRTQDNYFISTVYRHETERYGNILFLITFTRPLSNTTVKQWAKLMGH